MRGKYRLRKERARVAPKQGNEHGHGEDDDATVLVAVALIRERYGIMRREVDDLKTYVEAAKAEKAWYKAYAAGVIGLCTLIMTGVSWAANSQVIAKVTELVNQNRPAQVAPAPIGPKP